MALLVSVDIQEDKVTSGEVTTPPPPQDYETYKMPLQLATDQGGQ